MIAYFIGGPADLTKIYIERSTERINIPVWHSINSMVADFTKPLPDLSYAVYELYVKLPHDTYVYLHRPELGA